MNLENLEYLKKSLKYLGFGEKLNADLENSIKEQPDKFKLMMTGEFNQDAIKGDVKYIIDFKKSDTTDMYFMNSYKATLQNENPDMEKHQTFYINKGAGVTAKEAFNLLGGRAVNKDLINKDGEGYNAWLQLDFQEKDKNDNYKVKQYHSGYGYDLELTIAKYPIKEQLDTEQKSKLLKSLEKGNLTSVTFAKEGGEEKMFVEANPQYKTLNVYNQKFELQYQGVQKSTEKKGEKSPDKKEDLKTDKDDDPNTKKDLKTSKRSGVRV